MTKLQKEQITYMRGKGESYAKIAGALGVSESTVKSYCRRNNLGADYVSKTSISLKNDSCANCGCSLEHTAGSKNKRFCSDKCRMAWWKEHPESVNRKAIYRFKCPQCGITFESYGNAGRKFCSRTCFGMARRAAHV